jgi:2-iminobutanoate/2-iminopropanoate deaminase
VHKAIFAVAIFLKKNMDKIIIRTANAPAPIGPYNQAVLAGDTLYISGQICIDPVSGELKKRDIQEETHQVMQNLKAVLLAAGTGFNNVVKTTIFITDMNQFGEINEVYGKYFDGDFPARETVQVAALPKFVNVEISMIAIK